MNRSRPFALVALVAVFAAFVSILGQPTMIDFDSANFALAVEEENVLHHQPQPPGFVFYVALLRALAWLPGSNAFLAMRIAAVLLLAGTIALIHRFARERYGGTVALAAALLFAASPLALFHGMVSMIYPAEAFVSALVAYACSRLVLAGEGRRATAWLLFASFLAGAVGGLRQTGMAMLLPLLAYSVLRARPTAGRLALAVGAWLLGVVAWLLPQLRVSGGLEGYLEANRLLQAFIRSISVPQLGWTAILDYDHRLLSVLLFGFGIVKLPVLVASLVRVRRARGEPRNPTTVEAAAGGLGTAFYAIWIAPFLAFALFYHFPKPGYLLGAWPPFAILLGLAVVRGFGLEEAERSRRARAALLAAATADLVLFFLFPARQWRATQLWSLLQRPSGETAWEVHSEWAMRWIFGHVDFFFDRTRDHFYGGMIETLGREHGFPRDDVLFVGGTVSRLASWYFPDVWVLHCDSNRPEVYLLYRGRRATEVATELELPASVRTILVEGPGLEGPGETIEIVQGKSPTLEPRMIDRIGRLHLLGPGPIEIWLRLKDLRFPFPPLRIVRDLPASGRSREVPDAAVEGS